MEIRRDLVVPGPPAHTFGFVDDLGAYPAWMTLVRGATVDTVSVDTDSVAWVVQLQAQVGPFARSKQLRMVRTQHAPPTDVTFERVEVDGRSHSSWTLRVELCEREPARTEPAGIETESTLLTMTLTYGGRLWTGAVLQRVLDDEVRRGSDALLQLVVARSSS